MVSGCFIVFLGVVVGVWVAVVTAVGGIVVVAGREASVVIFLGGAMDGVASTDLV
jgi:hypothetical protein